jgi:hypothetical protein
VAAPCEEAACKLSARRPGIRPGILWGGWLCGNGFFYVGLKCKSMCAMNVIVPCLLHAAYTLRDAAAMVYFKLACTEPVLLRWH